MDMKRILQALDGVSTKPVEGASDMSKFLRIISEADLNQPAVESSEQVEEGANPHKVALPVQMAMNHYQQPKKVAPKRDSMLKQYFAEAESVVTEKEQERKALIKQYASVIAERVRLKEGVADAIVAAGTSARKAVDKAVGSIPRPFDEKEVANDLQKQKQSASPATVKESPIEMSSDPNDPHIYGHEKANPMSLKGRIHQARNQLKELANMAESDDLGVWQSLCVKAKGGMFMGLEQNLEQIRHGISELAKKRKQGGVASRGIDKNISERSVSQAQAHLMAAAAHNPEFAKKVKMKQSVAKEFNKADKGKNIKSLPVRTPKKK